MWAIGLNSVLRRGQFFLYFNLTDRSGDLGRALTVSAGAPVFEPVARVDLVNINLFFSSGFDLHPYLLYIQDEKTCCRSRTEVIPTSLPSLLT